MVKISGKSVFGGVSIGKLLFYQRKEKVIKRIHVDNVDDEWNRFQSAKNTAVSQLKGLYEKALEAGFLIRNCGNYRGLGEGYYRIAVRTKEENERWIAWRRGL